MSFAACAVATGASSCPCLTPAEAAAIQQNATFMTIGSTKYPWPGAYSSSYGVGCAVHDVFIEPYCESRWCSMPINGDCMPRWCSETWCWVNPASCSGVPPAVKSSYFSTVPLYFSYASCNGTNTFSDFYEAATGPTPPPPMSPPDPAPPPPGFPPPTLPPPMVPPPAAPPPYAYEREIAISSTFGGLLLLLASSAVAYYFFVATKRFRRQHAEAQRKRALAAIEMTRTIRFCGVFISAQDFLDLGRLVSHEEARDAGKLIFRDTYDDLAFSDDHTIFISQ